MKRPQPELSVCMIVKNEAPHIAEALSNFRSFADEIIVVDTGSTDQTKAIVERFTPHLFTYRWHDDFSSARNYSFEKARGRYLIWLDADDRFDAEMQQKLRALKPYFDGKSAFYFILHDVNAEGLSQSCYQLRCLPNMPGVRFRGRVHEQVYPSVMAAGLKTVTTDIVISHCGYQDAGLSVNKTRRNLAILEREREEGRDDEHIHYYLAMTYRVLGQEAKAIAAMERALYHLEKQLFQLPQGIEAPDFRPTLEAYLFLAPLYLKRGDHQRALRILTKAAAIPTQDALSLFRTGCLYQEIGWHTLGIKQLHSALSAESPIAFHPSSAPPTRKDILLLIAYSLMFLDQQEKLIEVLQLASEEGLALRESWEWVGCHALKQHQLDIALKAYQNVLETGELSAGGYCNLGMVFSRQGFPDQALACYRTAMQKDPKQTAALAGIAHLYFSLGRLKEAQKAFQQLVDGGAREIDILLALGVMAVRQRERGPLEITTRMIRSLPEPFGSHRELDMEVFYMSIAETLDAQGKPALARWAVEVARGLRGQFLS